MEKSEEATGATSEVAEDANESQSQSEDVTETPENVSKRQIKKLKKLQKLEELKLIRRKNEKLKRKEKRAKLIENGEEVNKGPSRKALKRNKVSENPADISVAIDLGFDDLMTDKDYSSLAAQLLRTYTSNRRAKKPIPLYFTSLRDGSKFRQRLDKNEGWKNWDIEAREESFIDIFDKSKIIYLTSDSDNVLDELEKGAVYVIGGIVDHNHHKSICLDNAVKNSIRTARLPLSEHLIIKTRTVLTVNQCFDIILGISEGREWKDVLIEVLPKRKNASLKNDTENSN